MALPLADLQRALANRFRVDRELGHGAMAVVYEALDLKHHRQVAIKVLRPELAVTLGRERFHREIEIAAQLSHPHILPLYNSGEADGFLYFVMPLIEGESLRERLRRDGRLPVEESVRIARQVADGLEYAHAHGVLHRDIKPENIMLTDEHALIADFGIARAVREARDQRLTETGLTVGTPMYMSPEQAGGEEVHETSDLYSLGCLVFEMLAGEPPFTGDSAEAILGQKLTRPCPRLEALNPEVSAWLADLIESCLAPDPADRPPKASTIAKALTPSHPPAGVGVGIMPSLRRRWQHWFVGWHRVAFVLLLSGIVGTSAVVVWTGVRDPDSGYAVPNPRQSFLALGFTEAAQDAAEDSLAIAAAGELTRQLNSWREARAVQHYALEGPKQELGIAGDIFSSLEDGIRLARRLRVGTLVALTARLRGETADLQAAAWDVVSRERLDLADPLSHSGPAADLYALVEELTKTILGFGGAPENLASLRRLSNDPLAVQEYSLGRDALDRWRLDPAADYLNAVILRDSGFALAYHYLALTRHWQGARDPYRLPELGPEAARLARRAAEIADRAGARLSESDAYRIRAFDAFQSGDYRRARGQYDSLLHRDSTDSYAWLMRGTVEFHDPWIDDSPLGEGRPRRNLNRAIRAFERSVKLSPRAFHLGWGHLFEIYQDLYRFVLDRECPAFLGPQERAIPPWEVPEAPEVTTTFCPFVSDSITWVSKDALREVDLAVALGKADSLAELASDRIERWATFSPSDPRPRLEWAAWLLDQRSHENLRAPPAHSDTLARQALAHLQRGLALKGDTTPEDRIRLGSVLLATGDVAQAASMTVAGLTALGQPEGGRLAPESAANLYLAAGQPSRALAIMSPLWTRFSNWAIEDPQSDRSIPSGNVEPWLGILRVHGATGLAGDELRLAFRELRNAWIGPEFDRRAVSHLRRYVTLLVAPALVLDEESLREWFTDWETVPPVWDGLQRVGIDPVAARRSLRLALDALEGSERPLSHVSAFLLGLLAQRVDEHARAIEFFGRLDRWRLAIDRFDPGWGLRPLSHLHRARSHEALGDTAGAVAHLDEFLRVWADADPSLWPILDDARAARERLSHPS